MTDKKLSHEEFVKKAIKSLRKAPYKGIHSVYSGFNTAFRKYFNEDPVAVTKKLAEKGVIAIRGARGGAYICFPGDIEDGQQKVLDKILE